MLAFQLHDWDYVENCITPAMQLPFNIRMRSPADTWSVLIAAHSNQFYVAYESSYLGDIGKWTDWVMNFKLSATSAGFWKVWRDGVLVVDDTGINFADYGAYAGYCKTDIQFGSYAWGYRSDYDEEPHNTTERIIYHDEFRYGDANSSYDEVAPSTYAEGAAEGAIEGVSIN